MVDIPHSSMVSTLFTDDSLGKKASEDEKEDEMDEQEEDDNELDEEEDGKEDEIVDEAREQNHQSDARGVSFMYLMKEHIYPFFFFFFTFFFPQIVTV